ncbi:hypothetical protein [Flavivirga algicola]|uniref:Uncharacterized protein n=1 Tax=Flavivirga algicola TaxID=2729136 RepID=A0ABX1RTU4_9FLAO|nr:hypothetical protein [Flavivirga algicola]NMH85929.1 hypothetical protein [Flavivirga algicola]
MKKNNKDSNFRAPKGVITEDRGKELSNAWSSKNSALFSKSGKKAGEGEIKYLRWSLEDLRNYLDYAEHEANKKGYDMTGVRVYFAAYPEKRGQNTLFFAPEGRKLVSNTRKISASLRSKDEENIPIPPFNNGEGGSGGY